MTTLGSSTPRWTIVCAIFGLMPEITHSAPISRTAAAVRSRCWATIVSTVETPVMSMIATSASRSRIACNRFSMTVWARKESSVPSSGTVTIRSQILTTGAETSVISDCWRSMIASRS